MQGESAKGQDEHDEGNPVLLATRVGKNVASEYTHFSLSLSLSLSFYGQAGYLTYLESPTSMQSQALSRKPYMFPIAHGPQGISCGRDVI